MKVRSVIELAASASIIGGLLWAAFVVKPHVDVTRVEPSPFAHRAVYYGVAAPKQDGSTIWAVGAAGQIVRSDDAGATFALQETPTDEVLQDILAFDADTAIALGDGPTILTTADGGTTWISRAVPERSFGDQLLSGTIDAGTGAAYVVGSYGTVLKSTDKGASWSFVYPEEDLAWNGVTVAPDGKIWLVGEFGRIASSADGGATWQEPPPPVDISLMSVAFADAMTGVAVGLSGTVLATSDGGVSWAALPAFTDRHIFGITVADSRFVAAGDAGGIISAGPTGRDWAAVTAEPAPFGWYTDVGTTGDRLILAGMRLGVLEGGKWTAFE